MEHYGICIPIVWSRRELCRSMRECGRATGHSTRVLAELRSCGKQERSYRCPVTIVSCGNTGHHGNKYAHVSVRIWTEVNHPEAGTCMYSRGGVSMYVRVTCG